jgi:hypothetical protein
MSLIRWEPKKELELFRDLRVEVERKFDKFFQTWSRPWSGGLATPFRPGGAPAPTGGFVPSVSLKSERSV